jgi:hypothetical protein
MIIGKDPEHRKKILKKSKKQERRTADVYKGSRNAGSGAGWLRKNDVRSHDFLFENKFTDNKIQYSLKLKDLKELRERAVLENRIPILQVDILNNRYVVITEDDFLELTGLSDAMGR